MTRDDLMPLVHMTLRDPSAAAKTLINWEMPRDVLWTALALVAALNTLLIQLVLIGSDPTPAIPAYFYAPLSLFVLMAGVMVIYVHALYWAGLAIKGKGRLDDLLAVVVWLQILRTGAQLGIVVISLLVPALSMVAMMIVSIWGFWILLNFIATALHLPSPAYGLLVLAIGLIGLVVSVSILLALVGVGAQGTTNHV